MRQCFPLFLKYSPMAHPEYGAKNYNGAASEAVAATTILCLRASWSDKVLTMFATVDLFCPIATYTLYKNLPLSPVSKFLFWLIMVSIAIAVFPVYLSPMINSLCPLPIGTKQSTDFNPVYIGSLTDYLGIIPGAFNSTLDLSVALTGPFPSIGFPSESKTLPNISSPMGTSTMAPVLLTTSPSWISLSLPNTTIPTLSVSKLSAIPLTPELNSTISPAWTLVSPKTLAIPSPIEITVPNSLISFN